MSRTLVLAQTRDLAIAHARDRDVSPMASTTILISRLEQLHELTISIEDRILCAPSAPADLHSALRAMCSKLPAIDTTTAARVLGVSPATISMWKRRERVFPVGILPADRGVRGGRGVPLYRLDQLLELTARSSPSGRERKTSGAT